MVMMYTMLKCLMDGSKDILFGTVVIDETSFELILGGSD